MKTTEPPTRILFISRSTSAHALSGGMEASFETVAAILISRGFEVSLVTTPYPESQRQDVNYSNVWEVEGCKSGKYSLRWWLKVRADESPWLLWKPDLIFSVSNAASSLVLNNSLAKKTIAQCHGTALAEVQTSMHTPSLRELAKLPLNLTRVLREVFFYRRIMHTISIGETVSRQLHARPIFLKHEVVTTIQNGVDADAWSFNPEARSRIRRQYNIPEDATVGIFNARLHAQKGADIAIQALTDMCDGANTHIFICGGGPAELPLKRLTDSSRAISRIHFTGRLSPTLLVDHMSASDVCIFPTRRREGLPLNILESLANGLEVITVESAGVPAKLRKYVRFVSRTAESVSAEWNKVGLSDERRSRLTPQFTSSYSLNAYADRVATIAKRIMTKAP